jgi:release factor glutamine methyltransferase
MSTTEEWSIGRLLQWTADYLKQHGSENPRLDAEVLLAHSAGCERIELYTRFNEPTDDGLRATFRQLVRRRAEGVPVAYLVGHREFYSMDFEVTADVLIPRPETEFVVIQVLDLLKQPPFNERPVQIADVGTGSGAIAVCVARHAPRAQVTAFDISPGALKVAEANARKHKVQDRIQFVQGDLLESLPDEPQFDIIASNPPYVTQGEFDALPGEIKDREPAVAFVAGADGMRVIDRLLPQSVARLHPRGALVMEISPMLEAAVVERLRAEPRWGPVKVERDLAGLSRVVFVRKQG